MYAFYIVIIWKKGSYYFVYTNYCYVTTKFLEDEWNLILKPTEWSFKIHTLVYRMSTTPSDTTKNYNMTNIVCLDVLHQHIFYLPFLWAASHCRPTSPIHLSKTPLEGQIEAKLLRTRHESKQRECGIASLPQSCSW